MYPAVQIEAPYLLTVVYSSIRSLFLPFCRFVSPKILIELWEGKLTWNVQKYACLVQAFFTCPLWATHINSLDVMQMIANAVTNVIDQINIWWVNTCIKG